MKPETVPTRHRILIAAAVTAVLGKVRIREVRPAAWTRRRPGSWKAAPPIHHWDPPADVLEGDEEETSCDS